MKRSICGLVVLLLIASVGIGKDKEKDDKTRTYDAPYEKVWDAVIASANENFVIEHSEKESWVKAG